MVIFTDGEDTHAIVNGRTLDEILQARGRRQDPGLPRADQLRARQGQGDSRRALDSGRREDRRQFYAADNEDSLLAAIEDIDAVSAGTIADRQYTSQQPRFAMFALVARVLLDWRARRSKLPCRIPEISVESVRSG